MSSPAKSWLEWHQLISRLHYLKEHNGDGSNKCVEDGAQVMGILLEVDINRRVLLTASTSMSSMNTINLLVVTTSNHHNDTARQQSQQLYPHNYVQFAFQVPDHQHALHYRLDSYLPHHGARPIDHNAYEF
jgi:hypothetical protein